MNTMLRNLLALGAGALLVACATGGGSSLPREPLQCPATQMVVCTGGTISKIGNSSRREPRFCDCVDRDNLNR